MMTSTRASIHVFSTSTGHSALKPTSMTNGHGDKSAAASVYAGDSFNDKYVAPNKSSSAVDAIKSTKSYTGEICVNNEGSSKAYTKDKTAVIFCEDCRDL